MAPLSLAPFRGSKSMPSDQVTRREVSNTVPVYALW